MTPQTHHHLASIRRAVSRIEQCAEVDKAPQYNVDEALAKLDEKLDELSRVYWCEVRRKGLVPVSGR